LFFAALKEGSRRFAWETVAEYYDIITWSSIVAEQVVFGDPEVTTGASNDFQQVATNIARLMVTLRYFKYRSNCFGG
jgi:hypothetical protein